MLEEGQSEWGEREGNGGTRKIAEREKEEGKSDRRGRGRKRRRNKGKSAYRCGDCGREEKGNQGQELQKQHKEKREGHGR